MNQFITFYNSACKKLKRGNFRKAIIDLKVCLRLNPEFFDALNKLAYTYNKIEEYEEAINTSLKVLSIDQRSKDALNNLFYAYDQSENFDEALMIIKKYIEIFSIELENSLKSHEKYNQFLKRNMYKRAADLKIYQKIDQDDFKSFIIKYVLPLVDPIDSISLNLEESFRFSKIGMSTKFVDILEIVVEKFPSFIHLWVSLGQEYLHREDFYKAELSFKRAMEIDSEDLQTWNNLGNFYFKINEFQKAINAFEHALKLQPRNDDPNRKLELYLPGSELKKSFDLIIWQNLGNAYNQIGEYKKAILACKNALKINPEKIQACLILATAYHSLGDHKKAIKSVKKGLKYHNFNIMAWNYLGSLYYEIENFKDARNAYKRIVNLDFEDFETLNKIALTFYEEGNVKKAIKTNARSLSINSQFEPALKLQEKLKSKNSQKQKLESL